MTARRWLGRGIDALAVLVVLAALFRLFVFPRLALEKPHDAPPISLARMDASDRFDLARHRGRVVFLDFWASWCGPCKLSIPLIQHYARSHPEVDVVSIDVGEAPAVATDYAKRAGMRDVAFDPEEQAAHAYGVFSYPTMIVIDPQGQIRAVWPGFNPAIELAMSDAESKYALRRTSSSARPAARQGPLALRSERGPT